MTIRTAQPRFIELEAVNERLSPCAEGWVWLKSGLEMNALRWKELGV